MARIKKDYKEQFEFEVVEVRESKDMDGLEAMVIPGGESTTMAKALDRDGFKDKIKSWMGKKPMIWGTCAGMILLAKYLDGTKQGGQSHLGGLDITVTRNHFGRQINSFEGEVELKKSLEMETQHYYDEPYHSVFIRAPIVSAYDDKKVEVLGTVSSPKKEGGSLIVAVQQDNIIATSFHPELTEDIRWHIYFLKLVIDKKFSKAQ
eukprot:gene14416-15923_t